LNIRVKRPRPGCARCCYLNWPLVLLVTAVASVGFLMLYSIAGGNLRHLGPPADGALWRRHGADVHRRHGADLVLALDVGRGLSGGLPAALVVEFFGASAWARSAGSTLASSACSRPR
jgi:hypothetical protein